MLCFFYYSFSVFSVLWRGVSAREAFWSVFWDFRLMLFLRFIKDQLIKAFAVFLWRVFGFFEDGVEIDCV